MRHRTSSARGALRLLVGIAVSVGAVLAVAAPAAADFRDDADELCIADSDASTEWENEHGVPVELATQAQRVEDLLPTAREHSDALAEIEVPKKLQAKYQKFLDAREARVEGGQDFVDAVKANDQDFIDNAFEDASKLDAAENSAARAVGLVACAELLSKADQKALKSTISFTFTHANPEFCTKQYTEAYVKAFSGSLEQCEADEQPENTNDSVKFTHLEGVTQSRANVDIVPQGGLGAGEPLRVLMVYVDGKWMRQGIFTLGG